MMWHSPGFYTWAIFVYNLYKRFPKMSTTYNTCIFANDTYITMAHEDISTIECSLNSDLAAVHDWLQTNKLAAIPPKLVI